MRKFFAKVCLLSVAAALLFAGCAKDNFKSIKGEGKVFTATIGQLTRTSLDANETGAKVNWVAGDEITINGVKYVAVPDASDATKAVFTKKNEADADPELVDGKYYASYGFSYNTSTATGTLAAAQTYSADGANAPMYAESETTVLDFNNICGVLEITLKGTETVSAIKVSSANLATSGAFTISGGQTAVLEDMGPDYKYDVTLDCGAGVALTAEGTKFYVAIPAGSYEALNVNVIANDGKSWSKATAATAAVEASKMYRLSFAPEFADHFEAKIGTTSYNTIAEAFAAATTDPCTITLLDNCISDKIEIAAGSDITLDLNGKTIDSYISNYGKLTIDDSSVDKSGIFKTQRSFGQNLYLRDGSETIINAGTIVGPVSDNAAIKAQKNSFLTINGGVIRGSYAVYFDSASANVTVNGGTLKGESGIFDLYAAGTLTIKDGYFNGPEIFTGNKKTANTVTEGGYYTVEPNFVSTGYAPKQLTSPITEDGVTYNYTVAEYNAKVEIAGTVYEDVAEAVAVLNAATSDISAKFLQNVVLQDSIVVNNASAKVTLDLNGKTIRISCEDQVVSALIVEGASTVVDIIDSVGGGMLDHTYAGAAYTLFVKSGTVNLISGNISNMTSSNYDRVAVRVLATDTPAYFNMTGGEVHGGRGIRVGGSETARAYLTISGGLVESRNTATGSHYSAVTTETGYCTILINGGTLTSTSQSVVYSSKSNPNVSITVTKNETTGTIPFIYCGGGCKYSVASGSTDYGDLTYNVKAWNFYTNISGTSYCGKPSPVKTLLDTPITDEYGYKYTYHLTPKDSN